MENGLRLRHTISKTKVIILGSLQYTTAVLKMADLPRAFLNGDSLKYETEVLGVGVWINENMDLKKHNPALVGKVHRILYTIRHFRHS